MDIREQNIQDRVSEYTHEEEQESIDQKILEKIQKYKGPSETIISNRLEELKNEWDTERYLEVNASAVALVGLLMGSVFSKKWFILSGLATGFLLRHGARKWSSSLPVFKAFGVRTRQEIEEEIYALKVIRGDFDNLSASSDAPDILDSLRE